MVSDEAVRAALAAREHALIDRPTPTVLSDEALMRIILEAVEPHLAREAAAGERERIAAWAEEHGAVILVEGDWSTLLPVADLLREEADHD